MRTARQLRFEDYDGFVEKFKPKLTTDDCYTPPAVYQVVLDFVRTLPDTEGREIVRPFYPGGDYENYDYPEGCIVVDNPPFSIYSRIVRFYLKRGIRFFLFAPGLTATVKDADVTYILVNSDIVYENGAKVNTAFCTNLVKDVRLWLNPGLSAAIERAQRKERDAKAKPKPTKIEHPINLVSVALLQRLAGRVELCIRKEDCGYLSQSEGLAKATGKDGRIFGCGFVLNERAAAERAAAERALRYELTERDLSVLRR